ncbi:MAG TPA: hypothetical protein ENF79_00165 [Nitrososphaeria archaeon]|nr:hypothetical protein [Nitrososphaeria archaeon]
MWPLRLEEEEVEEVEEAKPPEPVKVVEERPRTYRIGDHVVQEVVVEGQPVTWVRCLLCGAEAPLTKIAELKEKPCRSTKKEGETEEVEEERGGLPAYASIVAARPLEGIPSQEWRSRYARSA